MVHRRVHQHRNDAEDKDAKVMEEHGSDEIEVYDDEPPKKEKRRKQAKAKKPVPAAQEDVGDDILADFGDLNDISEEEKANLKMAILASRQDQAISHSNTQHSSSTDQVEDTVASGHSSQRAVSPVRVDLEDMGHTNMSEEDCLADRDSDKEEPQVAATKTMAVDDDDDDDETQPPEEEDNEEVGLDLNTSTLASDTQEGDTCPDDDTDQSVQDPVTDQSSQGFIQAPSPQTQPPTTSHESKSVNILGPIKALWDHVTGSKSEDSQVPQISKGRQSPGTDGPSEGSGGGQVLVIGRSDSQTSSGQASDAASQPEREMVTPLVRNYRQVQPQCDVISQYYCPVDIDPEKYAKVIYQMFEIYSRKLRQAQRQLQGRVEWGVPVKSGQHQSRTIDIKKRGNTSVYLDLTDDDDDLDDFRKDSGPQVTRTGSVSRGRGQRQREDSDEELPPLVIESEKLGDRNNSCPSQVSDASVEEILSAETQSYDIHTRPDRSEIGSMEVEESFKEGGVKEMTNVKARNDKDVSKISDSKALKDSADRTEKTDTCVSAVSDIGTVQGSGEIRKKRGRPGRKKAGPVVLVEDTQGQESDEDVWRVKQLDVIVEETQALEDENWLSVATHGDGKVQFENQMQKAQLKGFSIPKRGRGFSSINTATEGGVSVATENKAMTNTDSRSDDGSHVKKRGRGLKRRAVPSPALVEDTQDLEEDTNNNFVQQKKMKRKCFKLSSSDSEPDCVPESQEIGESEDSRDSVMSDKYVPEGVTNIPDEPTGKGTEIGENEASQSPVIRRARISRIVKQKITKESDDDDKLNKLIKRDEDEAFCSFKQSLSEKKLAEQARKVNESKVGSKTVRGSESVSFKDVGDGVKGGGVKRLFSRPASGESAASDDMSMASSQSSTTLIDDKGDIYSTQFCEARVGKKTRQSGVRRLGTQVDSGQKMLRNNDGEKVEEILKLDDSDDDVMIVEHNEVADIVERSSDQALRRSSRKQLSVKKMGKKGNLTDIRHCFKEKMKDSVEEVDENPLPGLKNPEQVPDDGVEVKKGDSSLHKSPVVVIPETEMFAANMVSERKGLSHSEHVPLTGKRHTRNNPRVDLTKGHEEENLPVSLGDFSPGSDFSERRVNPSIRNYSRRRNVIETMTRTAAEDSPEESESFSARERTQRGPAETRQIPAGTGTKRKLEGEATVQVEKKMRQVTCPLCDVDFPENVIEGHASNCLGPQVDVPDSPGEGAGPGERGVVIVHHEATPALTPASASKSGEGRACDQAVDDVVKDISSSPGETGEVQQCYVCDQYKPKGLQFERHLKQCMMLAQRQQAEVDNRGFNNFFTAQPEPEPEMSVRTTRRRLRDQQGASPQGAADTMRGRLGLQGAGRPMDGTNTDKWDRV